MKHSNVVIIGGGPAGRVIVHGLHAAGSDRTVTLIKDEPINVNRCAVPYGIAAEKPIAKYLIGNELVTDFGAELIIDRVELIDTARDVVTLTGGESIGYDRLVLATGARPVLPAIPGLGAANVTAVRSRDDLVRLRDLAGAHRRAVVVGGGYIGVEVAVVLRKLGLEVSIVEMLPRVMAGAAEPEMLGPIESDLTDHGIDLITGARVSDVPGRDGMAAAVRLEEGRMIETDFVVASLGVRPNVELAAAAGLAVGPTGIVVDDHLRTSVANIYAAGDCTETRSLVTGMPVRGEFGTNAVFMSKVVAANILGGEAVFPGVVNAAATRTFNYALASAGLTEAAARAAGLEVIAGSSEVLDRYPMMDGASPIRAKLLFEAATGRVVGGSVLRRGDGAAANADFISLSIQMGVTLDDLLVHQYATHPELAAKPSDNMYVFAAADAKRKRIAVSA